MKLAIASALLSTLAGPTSTGLPAHQDGEALDDDAVGALVEEEIAKSRSYLAKLAKAPQTAETTALLAEVTTLFDEYLVSLEKAHKDEVEISGIGVLANPVVDAPD